MKKKIQFFKDCGIGFVIVLVFLIGTLVFSNQNNINGSVNFIAIISPLLFIPLFIFVLQDKSINCSDEGERSSRSNKIGLYKKDTCILSVGTMLLVTLIVSMIVLYYGW